MGRRDALAGLLRSAGFYFLAWNRAFHGAARGPAPIASFGVGRPRSGKPAHAAVHPGEMALRGQAGFAHLAPAFRSRRVADLPGVFRDGKHAPYRRGERFVTGPRGEIEVGLRVCVHAGQYGGKI